jgi:dissimilatory sulfite reductase (desulfoviridin) alpha/beta subunit
MYIDLYTEGEGGKTEIINFAEKKMQRHYVLRRVMKLKGEYQKAAKIIAKLMELDEETKKKISEQIQSFGIGHFLENLGAFNFSDEVMDKLQALYIVLRYIDINKITELNEKGGASAL